MDKDGPASYSLSGPLRGCDPYGKDRSNDSEDMGRFYNFLLDLQEKIVQVAVENSVKWFGKKRSEDLIRESMKPVMRLHMTDMNGEKVPSGKYPPNVTLKIPVYTNMGDTTPRVMIDIVDSRGNPIYVTPSSLENVFTKGVDANIAVSASIYVMAGGGFGVTWRVSHAQVFQQARMTAASVFSDTIEHDDEEYITPESQAVEAPVSAPPLEIEIPDMTDDAVVTPPPAPRKRRAVPSS